jgi:hypothetical protein
MIQKIGEYSNKLYWNILKFDTDEGKYTAKVISGELGCSGCIYDNVQFLEAMLQWNTKRKRMHQMASSVIIFDEIQTIPLKCIIFLMLPSAS